jgi:hypothetical protein
MANLGLAYVNRAIGATVSGGSWQTALPASNVATRPLATVARSTNALTTSTKLQLDLGAARTLRAFALVNHNLSSAATWTIKLGTSSGGSQVYAGSAVDVWQLAAFDATVAALGVDDATYQRNDYAAIQVLGQAYSARYLTIEIADTGNADGFVQLGMVFAAGVWSPEVNAEYGVQDDHVDLSTTSAAESGAAWDTPRRRQRRVRFLLPRLSLVEGDQVHELQRVLGTVDDVLYVPDLADAAAQQRYGFVGRLQAMSALEYPFYAHRSKGFQIVERVP